jgi:hypothetical protein
MEDEIGDVAMGIIEDDGVRRWKPEQDTNNAK